MAEHSYSLRPLMEKDAQRMVEMMHDSVTTRYLQIGGPGYTEDTALGFIRSCTDESKHLHRAVVDENDVYQGSISLKNMDREKLEAEYAISMHPQAQGKGAAKAATAGILELAAQLGLNRVYLNVLAENERANRFYQKVGFRYTHSTEMAFRGEQKTLHWYEWTVEESK
jgi:diamine N-acetyltransferase